MRTIFLQWKKRYIILQIEKLAIQQWHDPSLLYRINELEHQLKSIEEYLD